MKKLKYLIFSIFTLLSLSLSFNVEARTSASNSALITKMKSPFNKNGWFHTFEWYGTATEALTTTNVEFLRSGNAVRIDPGQTSVTYYDYISVPENFITFGITPYQFNQNVSFPIYAQKDIDSIFSEYLPSNAIATDSSSSDMTTRMYVQQFNRYDFSTHIVMNSNAIPTTINVEPDYENTRIIEYYFVANITTVHGSIKIGNQTKTVYISFYEVTNKIQKINVIEENIDEDN